MPAPGWRGLCNATRRFCAETSAMLEQGLGKALPNKWQTMWQNIFKYWKFVATGRYLLSPFPCNTENFRSRTAMHVENFAEQNVWKGKAPAHGHRSHRTQFLPLFCSGVVRLAHRKCEVMAQYLVQTAYVRFKVQYEESRTQCGHYNLLLSSTRITLCGCAVNNQKQILEDWTTT